MLAIIHQSTEWIFAGFIIFIGIMVLLHKLMISGKYMEASWSIAVWILVYSLHKGSTAGIMSATFAALLFDLTAGFLLFRRRK